MNSIDEKMENLLKKLKLERGKRHSIEGHPLADQNDFIRNKYIQMICAILLYQNQVDEAQKLLLERIIAGAEAEYSAEDYMRMALEDVEEILDELSKTLKENTNLAYAFILDSLLLCNLKECSEEQAVFMAELFDVLDVSESILTCIANVAKSILLLDSEVFKEAIDPHLYDIDKKSFEPYARLIGDESVRFLNKTTLEEFFAIADGQENENYVVSDVKLDKENEKGFDKIFHRGESIVFRYCKFTCSKPLDFRNYKKITFEDCEFSDFNTEVVNFGDVTEAIFLRCKFTNCCAMLKNYKWEKTYVLIHCENGMCTEIVIDSCDFNNCGVRNSDFRLKSSIVSNGGVSRCINSMFDECWHKEKNLIVPDKSEQVLFSYVTEKGNNVILDSAKLCP